MIDLTGVCRGGPYDGQMMVHWSERKRINHSDFKMGYYLWIEEAKFWKWSGWESANNFW